MPSLTPTWQKSQAVFPSARFNLIQPHTHTQSTNPIWMVLTFPPNFCALTSGLVTDMLPFCCRADISSKLSNLLASVFQASLEILLRETSSEEHTPGAMGCFRDLQFPLRSAKIPVRPLHPQSFHVLKFPLYFILYIPGCHRANIHNPNGKAYESENNK